MSTFNDLLIAIRGFCDEKDAEINNLQRQIDGYINEREAIRKAFLEGNYEGLKLYFK